MDDWYTPSYIFEELAVGFDLDVAAPPTGPKYVPAKNWYFEKSLEKDWFGFVWMNPPYSNQKQKKLWLNKFFKHGNGIALMPDRTSADWFQEFVPCSSAQIWLSKKVKFERPDGSIGLSPANGSVLFSAGIYAAKILRNAKSLGFLTITKKENLFLLSD